MSASKRTGVITTLPYGEQQGSFMGVAACSNRDDGFFSGENNFVDHTIYTGYRYQCVEYARRFVLLTTGCVFEECGRATEIFKIKTIRHVETGEVYPLLPHHNKTSKSKPQPGDIIIYPFHEELIPWGHVGIISYVGDDCVGIAEQNQYFGRFDSPGPDYLDGEPCVARYIDLVALEDGRWHLKERSEAMIDCLGWMSYPAAPRRELVFAPLKPLPEMTRVRVTDPSSPGHPSIIRFRLKDFVKERRALYMCCNGSGETLVGGVTATARVLRFILQLLLDRQWHGEQFLALPKNPAGIAPKTKGTPALEKLLEVLSQSDVSEDVVNAAVAEYFSLPVKVVEAMSIEFRSGAIHADATCTFAISCAGEADIHSTSDSSCPLQTREFKTDRTHDQALQLCRVDFCSQCTLTDLYNGKGAMNLALPQLKEHSPFYRQLRHHVITMDGFTVDIARYVKAVELHHGKQRAMSIILPTPRDELPRRDSQFCDILDRHKDLHGCNIEMIVESTLKYDSATHTLSGTLENGEHVPSITFCYPLRDWAEYLERGLDECPVLSAAVDPECEIVFSKPLWSALTSGNVSAEAANLLPRSRVTQGSPRHVPNPRSLLFYDLCRRMYDYGEPQQDPENWSQEIAEYTGSCRRIHLRDVAPGPSESDVFALNGVMINFAWSCGSGEEYCPELNAVIPAVVGLSIPDPEEDANNVENVAES